MNTYNQVAASPSKFFEIIQCKRFNWLVKEVSCASATLRLRYYSTQNILSILNVSDFFIDLVVSCIPSTIWVLLLTLHDVF